MTAGRGALVLMLPLLVSCEVAKLEHAGRLNCRKGFSLVVQCEKWSRQGFLSEEERARVRHVLREGTDSLQRGMDSYLKAAELTGESYDLSEIYASLAVADSVTERLNEAEELDP